MDNQNPYEAPKSSTDATVQQGARPKSPKVFGILSLIFGGFGVLNLLGTLVILMNDPVRANPMELPMFQLLFSNVIGAVTIGLLLAAGLGLVRYQDKGRRWFNWYAVFTVVFTLINTALTYGAMLKFISGMQDDPALAGIGAGSLMFGIAAALAFPVIGYIMLNSDKVKAALSHAAPQGPY